MSTIKQGILGPFSGKVGSVIGATWNGIAYMRGIATSVTNPRTPAQLNQRAKFSTVIKFLRPLTSFLRVGFKSQANQMSAFNAAMAYNLQNAVAGIYPGYTIDYSKVLVSRGPLPGALNPEVASTIAGQITFTWDDNSLESGAMNDDQALLVIYDPAKQKAVTKVDGATRSSGTQIITLPEIFSGDQVECYIGFKDASQSVISDSTFVDSISVL